ncbi:hypothetical protein [Xenorhabdus bovienii]|uniref:Uncharacterized protein n=1 Tax=Xenorhabdus bovienii TaxID=40576 RepID=A0A0B6X8D5_XENBV|nr:hypothetical protein [Xenorhabdus bovienii]CDM88564.1 conserved membrane protein of unknown function [Xenorhabdus bovienii]
MLRINHITKVMSEVKPYAPSMYPSKMARRINKLSKNLLKICLLLLAVLFILIGLYKLTDYFKFTAMAYGIYAIYISGIICALIMMTLPPIFCVNFLLNWEKETLDEFSCEIAHDENNAEKFSDFTEKELLNSIYWIQVKINRITLRLSSFFGEKTAALSILGLSYTAVQSSIGFGELNRIFTGNIFKSDIIDNLIIFGLAILLGLSLGALMLKKVANHLLYLKEVIELAIKIRKDKESDGCNGNNMG